MTVSIIVAIAENGVIGLDGKLPWKLSADLKRFKQLTMGHPVLMGRKTCEEIRKPLPGRRNIVITRNRELRPEGFEVHHSIEKALRAAGDDPEIFIIGGAEVIRQALPLADRVYLTVVHGEPEGDTWLRHLDLSRWREVERSEKAADEKNEYAQTFLTYEKPA